MASGHCNYNHSEPQDAPSDLAPGRGSFASRSLASNENVVYDIPYSPATFVRGLMKSDSVFERL
jgi:hypothetical protein